jgi:putative hemolysin
MLISEGSYAKSSSYQATSTSLPALGNNEVAVYNTKYTVFKVSKVNGIRVANCNNTQTCAAARTPKKSQKTAKYSGSPASQFCSEQSGNNVIAYDFKKNEINLCEFSDGSLAYAWDMYRKAYPKSQIQ